LDKKTNWKLYGKIIDAALCLVRVALIVCLDSMIKKFFGEIGLKVYNRSFLVFIKLVFIFENFVWE